MLPTPPQKPDAPTAWLVPITGPAMPPLPLTPSSAGQVIGRQDGCDLLLPATADKVSRRHALLAATDGHWRVTDLGSRWGTFLNGTKLPPDEAAPLAVGDLLRIVPWTFEFSDQPGRRAQVSAVDDVGQTMVRTVAPDAARGLRDAALLPLLLEGAAAIHAAADERQLAESVMDVALRGTGLTNAAFLRPADARGGVDVVAARFASAGDHGRAAFSRSLVSAALEGNVVELSGNDDVSQSIVQMRISAAMCVPLKLGETVAALLYLDARATRPGTAVAPRPQAAAFAVALGQMASLALANLKRVEIERRQAHFEAELSAAAAAQRWILPKRVTTHPPFTVVGESRPGEYVGGDFFDVINLGGGRVAVALGDVSGHGVAAGVLMTATQGYLHAALRDHGDAARAVSAVNQFVAPRRDGCRFVTAWVGVFDANTGTVSYVDAGHGYGLLRAPDGAVTPLTAGDNVPIALVDDFDFTAHTAPLPPGGSVLIVSDGLVEQFRAGPEREQFGVDRVCDMYARQNNDPVAELFRAVFAFGGTEQLSDDATAVLVRWDERQAAKTPR